MEWYLKVLKNYATFSGRARRKEYWMFVLFNAIISIVLSIVDFSLGLTNEQGGFGIGNLYSLALLIPSLAVAVRRMHDVNKSGWFILIPIYNLILAVTEGDKGKNEYGEDPKDEVTSSDDLIDDILID